MLLSDFDYELPPDLIAQHPPAERGQSRLLVVPRDGCPLQHRMFADLPDYLRAGDCLILNDTRVIPARLLGLRANGGQAELLLLRPVGSDLWEALARPARRLRPGDRVTFAASTGSAGLPVRLSAPSLTAEVVASGLNGLRTVRLEYQGDLLPLLDQIGRLPLPPYIRRDEPESDDKSRYQTVYAAQPGAVAAPTAGLHFTPELLEVLQDRGVELARLTLHVGLGTFRPITAVNLEDHIMHSEWYSVSAQAAATINAARAAGGRLVAAGTTVVRTLETCTDQHGVLRPGEGMTDIFIKPGHTFRAIDALITNFHLPKSSLLVMVSALVGRERILNAYHQAIAHRYRFYSYGDATLII